MENSMSKEVSNSSTLMITYDAFLKRTLMALDKDRTDNIIISDDGKICPYGLSTTKKSIVLSPTPFPFKAKSFKEEINDVTSFFKFFKYQVINNIKCLVGIITINSGYTFHVIIEIPDDYRNSSPIAISRLNSIENRTFYNELTSSELTFSLGNWKDNTILEFVLHTIVNLNKLFFYKVFNFWPGRGINYSSQKRL